MSPALYFKTKPFPHQYEEWEQSRSSETRAIFWEPGLGKTKISIDTASHLYRADKIDCLFVLAPNGVHDNWIADEVPIHMPDHCDTLGMAYHSRKAKTKKAQRERAAALTHEGLLVVAMTYEGFMTKDGRKFADDLVKNRKCLMILDESTRIKSPNAKRTKSICIFGKKVTYKRILTGTPAVSSPFDLYAQIKFLDWGYWESKGLKTFAAFKAHHGIYERITDPRTGRDIPIIVGYKHVSELHETVKDVSTRLLKDDVLDLPPKLFSKKYFELTPEQSRLYKEIKEEFITFLDGEMVSTPLIITRMLRLQQIICGFLPTDDENLIRLDKNPRLELLMGLLEELEHSAIIWCRFREDIDWVMERLGDTAFRYDGKVSQEDRLIAKHGFQAGERKFFVANPAAGGTGLTLHKAKSVFYYSNSFSPEDRLQSEDRAHRIGQDGAIIGGQVGVHYTDLAGWGTIDAHIIQSLRNSFAMQTKVTGDMVRNWL